MCGRTWVFKALFSFPFAAHVGFEELDYITGNKQKANKEYKWGKSK